MSGACCCCSHRFARRPRWWLHTRRWMRWECVKCGFTTRTYDAPDRMAMRPIHPHMSVAFPGYNTVPAGVEWADGNEGGGE